MNSYFKMNRDYRESWLKEKQSEGVTPRSSYPNNLNYGDFFMFLCHPVFTYQDHYPLNKGGRPWKKIAFRLSLILFAVVN